MNEYIYTLVDLRAFAVLHKWDLEFNGRIGTERLPVRSEIWNWDPLRKILYSLHPKGKEGLEKNKPTRKGSLSILSCFLDYKHDFFLENELPHIIPHMSFPQPAYSGIPKPIN